LEDLGRRFARRPISSEQDLGTVERLGVEDPVHGIIARLCKIPDAQEEFQLGSGVWFDNHANALWVKITKEILASRQAQGAPGLINFAFMSRW
jgi:hypothetical protein